MAQAVFDRVELERRMRDRWRTVSRLWEEHKRPANKLRPIGTSWTSMASLSAQLEWRTEPASERPVRVVYSGWGATYCGDASQDDEQHNRLYACSGSPANCRGKPPI